MNILFISPTGDYAGIDVCLEMLVTGINKDKFNPVIIFPLESILKNKLEAHGFKCYRLPLYWWFPTGFCGKNIIDIIPTMRDKVDSILHIIRDNKIDLVFTNTTVNLDGAIAAAIARVPHVFHVHAPFVDNIYSKMTNESKKFIYQLMSKMSYKMVCCSKLLHEHMSNFVKNSCYIFNGVDIDKYTYKKRILSNNEQLKIVSIGHCNPNKRQEFVIEALIILKQINPVFLERVKYNIVGMGEPSYIMKIKDMVTRYRLEKHVTIEDFRTDINEYINAFTVYANSSETESLPLAVLEAMASGMPILASPNNGTMQLVLDGHTGFITETPRMMALRIVDFLSNPHLIEEMSEKARQRVVSHFSKEKYIESFEDLFNEARNGGLPTCDSEFTKNAYETLTEISMERSSKIKVLVICPDYNIPTYHIVARIPLNYLADLDLVDYRVFTPTQITIQDIAGVDIVYCIRCFDDYSYDVLRMSHVLGVPFVFYTDDNYFALKHEGENVIHTDTDNLPYARMFTDSDCIVVNSGDLFHIANNLNVSSVRLPTYQTVPTELNSVLRNRAAGVIRVGFMGTLKREGDFAFVTPALKRILSEFRGRIRIEFIGFCPEELKDDHDVDTFPFIGDYDEFRSFFESRAWDIGLAPLAVTKFNECKTNNKYREYSALGIAGVYSDISSYNSCVIDGKTGLLVENSEDAWYQAIRTLIEDEGLRRSISSNCHEDIVRNYPLASFAHNLFHVFENCCDNRMLQLRSKCSGMPCSAIEKLKRGCVGRERFESVKQEPDENDSSTQSAEPRQLGRAIKALKELFSRLLARAGLRGSIRSRLFRGATDFWQCVPPIFGDIESYMVRHHFRRHGCLLQLTDSFHNQGDIVFEVVFRPGTLDAITCMFTTGTAQEALVGLELVGPNGSTVFKATRLISLNDPHMYTRFDVGNLVIDKESKWLIRLSVLSPWPVYSYELVSRHCFGLLRRSFAPLVNLTYTEELGGRQDGVEASTGEIIEETRERQDEIQRVDIQNALKTGRFCASYPAYSTIQAFAEQFIVPRFGKWKLGLSPNVKDFPYLEYSMPQMSLGFYSVLIGVGASDYDHKGKIGIEIVSSDNVILTNVTMPLLTMNHEFPLRFVLPKKIQMSSKGGRIRVFVSSEVRSLSILEIQSQSVFGRKIKTYPYLALE